MKESKIEEEEQKLELRRAQKKKQLEKELKTEKLAKVMEAKGFSERE